MMCHNSAAVASTPHQPLHATLCYSYTLVSRSGGLGDFLICFRVSLVVTNNIVHHALGGNLKKICDFIAFLYQQSSDSKKVNRGTKYRTDRGSAVHCTGSDPVQCGRLVTKIPWPSPHVPWLWPIHGGYDWWSTPTMHGFFYFQRPTVGHHNSFPEVNRFNLLTNKFARTILPSPRSSSLCPLPSRPRPGPREVMWDKLNGYVT